MTIEYKDYDKSRRPLPIQKCKVCKEPVLVPNVAVDLPSCPHLAFLFREEEGSFEYLTAEIKKLIGRKKSVDSIREVLREWDSPDRRILCFKAFEEVVWVGFDHAVKAGKPQPKVRATQVDAEQLEGIVKNSELPVFLVCLVPLGIQAQWWAMMDKIADATKGKLRVLTCNIWENQEVVSTFKLVSTPWCFLFKNGKPVKEFGKDLNNTTWISSMKLLEKIKQHTGIEIDPIVRRFV